MTERITSAVLMYRAPPSTAKPKAFDCTKESIGVTILNRFRDGWTIAEIADASVLSFASVEATIRASMAREEEDEAEAKDVSTATIIAIGALDVTIGKTIALLCEIAEAVPGTPMAERTYDLRDEIVAKFDELKETQPE